MQFQYFNLHLNSIGIRETKKEKKLLTNNYYTKLLKFCCSGHWDINHPTINSPFGDSFWHRLGLMQDQHVRVAYCNNGCSSTWLPHLSRTRQLWPWSSKLWTIYMFKVIRPATKCARAYMWHWISFFFTNFLQRFYRINL